MSFEKWFVNPKPRPNAQLRIICFPYAGGNAATYNQWPEHLYDNVEVIGVQAPGRSSRLFEPAIDTMEAMIASLMPLLPDLLDKPYILFGHSLGSRIAFETLVACDKANLPLPVHFIASGGRGPHLADNEDPTIGLSDSAFVAKLRELEGTPEEVLNNSELMELLLPLIRAEFALSERYQYQGNAQFDVPLSIFGGVEDDGVSKERLLSWQQHFSNEGKLHMFPGGHFFVESEQRLVTEKINQIVRGLGV